MNTSAISTVGVTIKSLLLSFLVLSVSTGLNILIIMLLWEEGSPYSELWTIQVVLPALLYRLAIVYGGEREMSRSRLSLAVLTPLLSVLLVDCYRIFAYYLDFGRSFDRLGSFLPCVYERPMVFLKSLVEDIYNRWWIASLYIFVIMISVIIHYPSEVRAFFEHLKKKFAVKRK